MPITIDDFPGEPGTATIATLLARPDAHDLRVHSVEGYDCGYDSWNVWPPSLIVHVVIPDPPPPAAVAAREMASISVKNPPGRPALLIRLSYRRWVAHPRLHWASKSFFDEVGQWVAHRPAH